MMFCKKQIAATNFCFLNSMNDSTLDLFSEHPDTEDVSLEDIANLMEITVDYLLMAFVL